MVGSSQGRALILSIVVQNFFFFTIVALTIKKQKTNKQKT